MASNGVVKDIPVGHNPVGVAVNPAGTKVYVVNMGSGFGSGASLSVIDTTENDVVATIPLTGTPMSIAINPVSARAYVTNVSGNSVFVIDTDSNTVVATIPAGTNPIDVTVNPAGTKAYVANRNSPSISVINTATNTVVETIPVSKQANGITINPDGTKLYVSASGNTVFAIDTATSAVTSIPLGDSWQALGQIALNPAGTTVYVGCTDQRLYMIDTATNGVSSVPVSGLERPMGVEVNSAGTKIYLIDYIRENVLVIDQTTYALLRTIPAGSYPTARGTYLQPSQLNISSTTTAVTAGTTTEIRFTVTDGSAPVVPMNGVTVTLSGGATDSAVTDASGVAVFSVHPTTGSTITATASKAGCTNGQTTVYVNMVPVLAGVPSTLTVDELAPVTFTATATDANTPAQTLTFSLENAPPGATIDSSSGMFSWTPSEVQGPGNYELTVIVSDGIASVSKVVTINVNEVADPVRGPPPTISMDLLYARVTPTPTVTPAPTATPTATVTATAQPQITATPAATVTVTVTPSVTQSTTISYPSLYVWILLILVFVAGVLVAVYYLVMRK